MAYEVHYSIAIFIYIFINHKHSKLKATNSTRNGYLPFSFLYWGVPYSTVGVRTPTNIFKEASASCVTSNKSYRSEVPPPRLHSRLPWHQEMWPQMSAWPWPSPRPLTHCERHRRRLGSTLRFWQPVSSGGMQLNVVNSIFRLTDLWVFLHFRCTSFICVGKVSTKSL